MNNNIMNTAALVVFDFGVRQLADMSVLCILALW